MDTQKPSDNELVEHAWLSVMRGETPVSLPILRRHPGAVFRHLFGRIQQDPRCRLCNAPFQGRGAAAMRLIGRRPSNFTPLLCNKCEQAARSFPAGAEIDMSLLFADVRGSTALGEGLSPGEFSRVIDRFYQATTQALVTSDAFIDKLSGDEVLGVYLPGFAGAQHAHAAIQTAIALLEATGHRDPEGPWVPVGAGVHSGLGWIGAVGHPNGQTDITVLGDTANTAARLASRAGPGEVVVSLEATQIANWPTEGLERRRLEFKGKAAAFEAVVLEVSANSS